MSNDKQVKGTVVRGADGVLYLIREEPHETVVILEANVPRLTDVVKNKGKDISKGGPEHIDISAEEAAVADVHMHPQSKQVGDS